MERIQIGRWIRSLCRLRVLALDALEKGPRVSPSRKAPLFRHHILGRILPLVSCNMRLVPCRMICNAYRDKSAPTAR